MEDNNFYQRAEVASIEAKETALKAALAHGADIIDFAYRDIPSSFGAKWKNRFARVRKNLTEKYGNQFDSLILLSQRSYVYSIVQASSYMYWMFHDVGGPRNEVQLGLTSPESYADQEGWAYTLANGVCAELHKPNELLKGTAFTGFPDDHDVLTAMAIVWFFDAAQIRRSNESKAMDLLFEAADALDLATGRYMWDEGEKSCEEENRNENPAAAMARLRHADNYALADEARKYWRENIDPTLSAQKAADNLLRVVPLSHKKLAELVAAEKKKLS